MAYEAGERVLAFHQNMLYEAKVLQLREAGGGVQAYRIHYRGWKDRWDEWVPAARMLKLCPQSLAFQRRMREAKGRTPRARPSPAPAARTSAAAWAPPPLPPRLQRQLLLERRALHARRLARIPARPSVADVLVVFADARAQAKEAVHTAVLDGIQLYFERALGTVLLYKFEKLQYRQLLQRQQELAGAGGVVPAKARFSHLYGAPHLLRLLCKMPELLAGVELEEEARALIVKYVEDLVRFLDTHADSVFDPNGMAAASAAYLEEAL